MGRILFIDSLSPIGHINFNNIHISALIKAGFKVECAFPEGYSDLLTIPDNVIIHEFKSNKSSNWRFVVLKFLKDVKSNLNLHTYDFIIHSSYDDVTLLLSNYPKSIIINHNNLSKLHSKLRRIIFKLISYRHIHVSLSNEIQEFLNGEGINNILIQHGLVTPFSHHQLDGKTRDKSVYEIFIPSAGSSDFEVLMSYFANIKFLDCLKKYNIRVSIRNTALTANCDNIRIIKDRLSDTEYAELFVEADLIWLPYPNSFENRVSGVLMEAIANQKDVLLPNIKAFKQYTDFISPTSYYNSIDDVISSILNKIEHPDPISLTLELKKRLSPDYSVLNYIQNI